VCVSLVAFGSSVYPVTDYDVKAKGVGGGPRVLLVRMRLLRFQIAFTVMR